MFFTGNGLGKKTKTFEEMDISDSDMVCCGRDHALILKSKNNLFFFYFILFFFILFFFLI